MPPQTSVAARVCPPQVEWNGASATSPAAVITRPAVARTACQAAPSSGTCRKDWQWVRSHRSHGPSGWRSLPSTARVREITAWASRAARGASAPISETSTPAR